MSSEAGGAAALCIRAPLPAKELLRTAGALRRSGGNLTIAAKLLGLSADAVGYRVRRYPDLWPADTPRPRRGRPSKERRGMAPKNLEKAESYTFAKQLGLCPRCKGAARSTRVYCAKCGDYYAGLARARRAKRRAARPETPAPEPTEPQTETRR